MEVRSLDGGLPNRDPRRRHGIAALRPFDESPRTWDVLHTEPDFASVRDDPPSREFEPPEG
jgi:hypothetical protein